MQDIQTVDKLLKENKIEQKKNKNKIEKTKEKIMIDAFYQEFCASEAQSCESKASRVRRKIKFYTTMDNTLCAIDIGLKFLKLGVLLTSLSLSIVSAVRGNSKSPYLIFLTLKELLRAIVDIHDDLACYFPQIKEAEDNIKLTICNYAEASMEEVNQLWHSMLGRERRFNGKSLSYSGHSNLLFDQYLSTSRSSVSASAFWKEKPLKNKPAKKVDKNLIIVPRFYSTYK